MTNKARIFFKENYLWLIVLVSFVIVLVLLICFGHFGKRGSRRDGSNYSIVYDGNQSFPTTAVTPPLPEKPKKILLTGESTIEGDTSVYSFNRKCKTVCYLELKEPGVDTITYWLDGNPKLTLVQKIIKDRNGVSNFETISGKDPGNIGWYNFKTKELSAVTFTVSKVD